MLLSVGIALAVAAGLLTAWQVAASRPGKLAVRVTGLPANSRFALHISGANGFSEELTSDKTFSVDPGDYRITAKASHAKGNVYYTADETTTWTVGGGETERAVIDYAVALSEKTTVLSAPDSADSGLLKRPGTSELVFAAGSATARKLKKGDFVVAAESERTPRGLVRDLGATKCWPGWAAVVWSDTPHSDFVMISVFKRNARHFLPGVHLLPVMEDPYDPDWLRDCGKLRGMKPPVGLISFVGCTAQSNEPVR